MAGGIGSRFWPMSRNAKPKQFIDILGSGQTLIQQTYNRFTDICPEENIFVVTSDSYVELVSKQLPKLKPNQILAEPQRRNTAPCIAYAAFKIASINPDANLIVAPSDHVITQERVFHDVILKGLKFTAEQNRLLTIGIQPSRPDTGYGYIQFMPEENSQANPILKVKTFTEKPNLEMAKSFLKSGDFLWNAGIFVWNAKSILNAIKEFQPDIYSLFDEGQQKYNTPEEDAFIQRIYALCTNISIDYGVMEKAKNVYTLSTDFGWSDLGTWKSLYEHLPHDAHENAILGDQVMIENTNNCIIHISKDKLALIQGMENFIIVDTENVLLICRKDDEQQVRNMVNEVKIKKGEKYT
ncbi:MAG: Alginate biosynthesis protein AlgA [Bacteroidota bacterium]|jgi:mannose-1-phosphate guanylyltransferase